MRRPTSCATAWAVRPPAHERRGRPDPMGFNAPSLCNLYAAFHLQRLRANIPFDPERIRALQVRKLRALLDAAARRHPFYRERLRAAGLDPRGVTRVEDLRALPILERAELRDLVQSALDRDRARYAGWFRTSTSGSTGAPLPMVHTWPEQGYALAKFLRAFFLNGLSPRDLTFSILLRGKTQKPDSWIQRYGFLGRATVLSDRPVAEWADAFAASGADALYANRSHLVELALELRRRPRPFKPLKFCLSAGEVLDPVSADLLESVFGRGRLTEVYGTSEMSTLACRLPGRDEMLCYHDTEIFELIERDPARPDTGGIVVTDLHFHSFPMIRYRLGDRVETAERDGLMVLRRVCGRDNDYVVLPDGSRRTWLEFSLAVLKARGVWKYRIIQETPDRFRILVVAEPGIDRDRLARQLVAELEDGVARGPVYEIEYVPDLPPDRSGKLRMIISHVPAARG